MHASQNKGSIFHKEDFETLNDKIKQLMTVLIRLGRSGLDFRPDVDTVMDGEIISSLNQQLEVLINFVSKLLSDNSSPSFGQVSLRSPLGRLFAFKTVLDDYYERLNKLVDPTRQMYVGSPPSSQNPVLDAIHDAIHKDECVGYDLRLKDLYAELYNYIKGGDVKTLMLMGDTAFNRHQFLGLGSLNDSRSTSSPVLAIPPVDTDSIASSQSYFSSGIDDSDSSLRTHRSRRSSSFFSDVSSSSEYSDSEGDTHEGSGSDTEDTQFEMDF